MNFEFMTIGTPLPPCMPFPRALTGFPVSSTAKVMYCRMLDAILFLRKTAEIDKPYYTLEVEPNGTIRQKRTYFDRQNDDLKDAEQFLKEWQRVVSERLTESDREKAEKSKILRLQEFEQLRQDDIRIHTGDLAGQRLVDVLVSDLMETAA